MLLLAFFACFSSAPPPQPPAAPTCFTAVTTLHAPSQPIFEAAGRSGNGETWYTLLEQHVSEVGTLGEPTVVRGVGDERSVTFDGRSTWVSFDPEAGGCLVCSGDAALAGKLEAQYRRGLNDPKALEQWLGKVPASAFSD